MLLRWCCAIWGHAVDNGAFAREGRRCTRCRAALLADDGTSVRLGHTLSCFLRHHTYREVIRRDDHTEYACVRCGHPLLFRHDADPYRGRVDFAKKVRYLCGLFGHRVHVVTERDGGTEYACHCGHSFVHQPRQQRVVRHPMACVLLGHWVTFVGARGTYSEYACRTCGHPFLFAQPNAATGQAKSTPSASAA
jgi:DNA-directed RNA polymerase subunit RPC12/RpoP